MYPSLAFDTIKAFANNHPQSAWSKSKRNETEEGNDQESLVVFFSCRLFDNDRVVDDDEMMVMSLKLQEHPVYWFIYRVFLEQNVFFCFQSYLHADCWDGKKNLISLTIITQSKQCFKKDAKRLTTCRIKQNNN